MCRPLQACTILASGTVTFCIELAEDGFVVAKGRVRECSLVALGDGLSILRMMLIGRERELVGKVLLIRWCGVRAHCVQSNSQVLSRSKVLEEQQIIP